MYVCMYVCMYVYMFMSVCMHVCIHSYIHVFIHSFIDSFIHIYMYSFIHSLIDSFIHWFVDSFIDSLIDWLIYWFIRSFIHWLIDSLIHSFIHSVTHSFMHLFIQSMFTINTTSLSSLLSPLLPWSSLHCSRRRHRHRHLSCAPAFTAIEAICTKEPLSAHPLLMTTGQLPRHCALVSQASVFALLGCWRSPRPSSHFTAAATNRRLPHTRDIDSSSWKFLTCQHWTLFTLLGHCLTNW